MVTINGVESGELRTDDPILEVRDVSVTFDMERGQSRVLDSVDIDVRRGEILGVVGESGSGKSMFASALLDAVVEPGLTTGDITYYPPDDEPIDVLDLSDEELRQLRWEEIAMVFQGAMSSFNPTRTIGEHFHETLDAHDAPLEPGMERARQLLSDLYLDPDRVLDSYAQELSGGMQQRALIALALVLEPEVLVMDEPTAALDLLMQRSIIALLDDLKEKYNLSIVFITHDLELISNLADRLAVMYAFELVEISPADELVLSSNHPYTRALINSTPNLDTAVDEMRPIEGTSPDPVNVPTGCSYHPRCPLADERCEIEDPELYGTKTGGGHHTACHYQDEVDEAIPLSIEEVTYEEQDATQRRLKHTSPENQDTVLSLEDVEVHFETGGSFFDIFGESEVVQAVDGISLDIGENDVVALIGESGCGKTTLGKTAIGLQRPTSGSVNYRGQDIWETKNTNGTTEISHEEIRRTLQIIHQDPGSSLNPNKMVRSILAAPLKQWHPDLNALDRQARIHGMLERVGMSPADDYANRYPHQLSGGEKQRVALVRALLLNPDVILADEAVSALDVSLRVDMMDLLLDLQQEFNTSFVFISHNFANARYLAEHADGRIGIMYLGTLVEVGPADEVLKDPQHPYTNVLKWGTPDLDPSADEVEETPVRTIDIPDPTDPPDGCRFHTRCPYAREVCIERSPELTSDEGHARAAACFRAHDDDHPYWSSPSLVDESERTTLGLSDRNESELTSD